jgi:hypothetical protein
VSEKEKEQEQAFKDATLLTTWVTRLIYLEIVLAAVSIVSGALEYQLLDRFEHGLFATESLAQSAAEANDQRQAAIGIAQIVVTLVTAILVLKWIYRANYNARQLGAADMKFTPGWAAGWYFIPIASLWKPYQAMKEIWMASSNPGNWTSQPSSPLLPWWWFLWLLTNGLGQASFRLAENADTIHDFKVANVVTVMSDICIIPLDLVFLAIVKTIYDQQMKHHRLAGDAEAAATA